MLQTDFEYPQTTALETAADVTHVEVIDQSSAEADVKVLVQPVGQVALRNFEAGDVQ